MKFEQPGQATDLPVSSVVDLALDPQLTGKARLLVSAEVAFVRFAGEGLDRMFVTSAATGLEGEPGAGALFEVDPGVRGLPPHRFGG